MTTFNKQIRINASKKKVWAVLANLGDIYKFNPNVSKSYYTSTNSKGIGAARICELRPTGKIVETATSWHEEQGFTLHVEPIEKAPPVKNFLVSVEIDGSHPDFSVVHLNASYSMKLGLIGKALNNMVLKSQMEKALENMLKGLKFHIEKGIEVVDQKSLNKISKVA